MYHKLSVQADGSEPDHNKQVQWHEVLCMCKCVYIGLKCCPFGHDTDTARYYRQRERSNMAVHLHKFSNAWNFVPLILEPGVVGALVG